MQNKRFMQNVTIITLGVLICCLSVAFAIYGTDLEVGGTVKVKNANWDIHFENIQQTSATNIVDTSRITPPATTGTTSLTFGVSLKVGEVYEFTTDIKNAGTFNAKLATVSLNGTKKLDAENREDVTTSNLGYTNDYLKYTVTYADGTAIQANDTLDATMSKKIKVHVEYMQPQDSSKLPTAEEEFVFTLNMNYQQV